MESLNKFWEFCQNNKTDEAKEYILSRQFNLDDFEWGFFPENEESEKLLKEYKKEFEDLYICFEDFSTKQIKSFFYNRLIFPIKDISGEVIAVAGRGISEPSPKPKYYNSKYDKKYNLFYLNEAIPSIRKNRFVLVCEGYFAALRLHHTCGIKNVVASCGTLFTRGQLDSLSRYTTNICFLRDNDEAGEEATNNTLEKFKGMNHLNLFQVKLDTQNDDPDDYIVKYGKAKFIELVKKQLILK